MITARSATGEFSPVEVPLLEFGTDLWQEVVVETTGVSALLLRIWRYA